MRIFKMYSTKKIVKHVMLFFKGHLYIKGRGGYTFDHGKLLLPDGADERHAVTVSEVNSAIAELAASS